MPKIKKRSKEPMDELVEELQEASEEIKTATENISSAPKVPEVETFDKRHQLILASEDNEITQSVKYLMKASVKVISKLESETDTICLFPDTVIF